MNNQKTDTILDTIVAHKILELQARKAQVPLAELQRVVGQRHLVAEKLSFSQALSTPREGDIAIIAEIKRASPSAGTIKAIDAPIEQALAYEQGHCDAISVLTDEKFFNGSLDDLHEVGQVVITPTIRKDFIIDEYQIFEAALADAQAFLLIAAILTKQQIETFLDLGKQLHLDALVEVHTEEELETVLQTKASIIGINSRNLKDFSIDREIVRRLASVIPSDKLVVAESGISTREDILFVKEAGCRAALVGTALMKTDNPAQLIMALKGLKQ
ncbi:MAG: indole-3-glycerol phosphate synthase TrpC [bacterium]